nr:hypothetical protein BaRGS_014315 [Batillaria attramentaria]
MNYTPKSYLCSECGHSCQTPTMLKYHMKRHSGVRDFHCTHCTSSFFTQAFKRGHALHMHMVLHKGVKKHAHTRKY